MGNIMKRILTTTLLFGSFLSTGLVFSQSRMMKSADVDEETRLKSEIEIDYGVFKLNSVTSDVLFNLDVTYDKDKMDPDLEFRRSGELAKMKFSTNSDGVSFGNDDGEDDASTKFRGKLELGSKVEHDIRFSIGAGAAELDLSNLKVSNLDLSSGAGSIRLFIKSLNQAEVKKCNIQSGVGEIKATGLNNLNFQTLSVENGVGSVFLDFAGLATGNKKVNVETGVGEVKIMIPATIGVRIKDNSGFFSNLTVPSQFNQHGEYYTSSNYKTAKTTIDFDVSSGIGSIIFISGSDKKGQE